MFLGRRPEVGVGTGRHVVEGGIAPSTYDRLLWLPNLLSLIGFPVQLELHIILISCSWQV